MSDPWIKVYPSDMRGDPAIIAMNPARRYALIQAWDLAKNGPGAIDELRSNDGSTMTERELRQLATVSQHETRQLFNDWATRGLCTYKDGLVRFPSLAKRQGIDASAAERKRRERERKRHGDVTPKSRQSVTAVSRDVTGENQKLEEEITTTPPSQVTPRQAGTNPRALGTNPRAVGTNPRASITGDVAKVWEAFVAHHPKTPRTIDRVQRIQRRLRDFDADTLVDAIDGNHLDPHCNGENDRGRQYHDLGLILRSADTIERYAAIKREANGNGHALDQLTAEDFDRMEAERERITAERRSARAQAEDEEIPF